MSFVARRRAQEGFTLVEVLVAVVILSIAMVSIVGAMTSTFSLTDQHRGDTTTDAVARSFAEAIQQAVANETSSTFVPCPTTAYLTSLVSSSFSDEGFAVSGGTAGTVAINAVEYEIAPGSGNFDSSQSDCLTGKPSVNWAGYSTLCADAEGQTCPTASPPLSVICPPCDPGLERVTITATAIDPKLKGAKYTTQFMVRRGNAGGDT